MFCLQEVFDHLKTPGNKPQQGEGAETPLSEVIERNLKAAVANSNRSQAMSLTALTASPQLAKEPELKIHEQVYITSVLFNTSTLKGISLSTARRPLKKT